MRPGPLARRFARARSGASAVEFAIIVPILLGLFMAAVELPRAFSTAKRLDLAASTMADLISGTNPPLDEVFAAAQAVATPYDIGAAGIVLTAAGVYLKDGAAVARVCSSAAQKDEARSVGSVIGPAPTGSTAGGRYVMAEVRMRYAALFRVFPTLANWAFSYTTVWPVREGRAYWGNAEVVLPGGQPCPPV